MVENPKPEIINSESEEYFAFLISNFELSDHLRFTRVLNGWESETRNQKLEILMVNFLPRPDRYIEQIPLWR
jgi:hypothetical protein